MTPLLHLLRECEPVEREQIAVEAGTSVNYLYALAGCVRATPNVRLAFAIEDASTRLHRETGGRTRVVTARELATMCSLNGFGNCKKSSTI